MSGPLKSATINNFKGIVHLEIHPDGHGVVFQGPNGSGKTSAIDAFAWGLGLNLDEEVVRNGADKTDVDLVFEGYRIERTKKRGGKPTIKVKDDKGRPFNSPTALLASFAAALDRRTFSRQTEKEQAAILRQIAPGLDVADLDGKRAELYAERTDCGRRGKLLDGQVAGIAVPEAPEAVGEEKSLADLMRRQSAAQEQLGQRDQMAAQLAKMDADAKACEAMIGKLEAKLVEERAKLTALRANATTASAKLDLLPRPDLSALEQEAATLEQHNAQVRAARKLVEDATRAKAAKDAKQAELDAARAEWKTLTAGIDAIDAEKVKRLASVKLPVQGLALTDGVATFDDGAHGPVAIGGLNSATRIRLDVAIGAALGHKLVSAPEASLLDSKSMADLDAFAREHGMQLLAERVIDGAPGAGLVAVIEEGAASEAAPEAQPVIDAATNYIAAPVVASADDTDDFDL